MLLIDTTQTIAAACRGGLKLPVINFLSDKRGSRLRYKPTSNAARSQRLAIQMETCKCSSELALGPVCAIVCMSIIQTRSGNGRMIAPYRLLGQGSR